MKVITIKKTDWAGGIEKSRAAYRLFGPRMAPNKNFSEFRELCPGEQPDMDATNTRLSPKTIVFPPSEVLLQFTTDEKDTECNVMKATAKDYSPRAVIGIRPYDAAAFQLVKKNFDAPDVRDPYWCDAFEACTLIGLAVNRPDSLDFSTCTGSGPFDEKSLDVLLVDTGDAYLAEVLTPKGEAWLKAAGFNTVAGGDAEKTIQDLKTNAEARIKSSVAFDNIRSKTILELYNAPFWNDVAFACINCGTCTYVCPTCWCFDIQDETHGKYGERLKAWDSCMFPLFTLHTTGHNPRGAKIQRVRQRFMHKLKYFLDKYDDGIMCVGCGRCIRSCPVNIDIRHVCDLMNQKQPDACSVKG